MSEPIKVGDLAVIIKPPLSHQCNCLGVFVTVKAIRYNKGVVGTNHMSRCAWCGWTGNLKCIERFLVAETDRSVIALDRLKRIPPLSELGQLTTEQWMEENA